jgi:hypothetical protein
MFRGGRNEKREVGKEEERKWEGKRRGSRESGREEKRDVKGRGGRGLGEARTGT